jgi:hypothetical protein
MDSRLHNILNYQSKNADQLIKEKFSAAQMNNAKWVKMINTLAWKFDSFYVDYKLIYDDIIEGFLFELADKEPFFIEPIMYKEVEWIEFPNSYEDWININNKKAGKKEIFQDIDRIKAALYEIGKFDLETYENRIRLYGYK